MRPRRALQRHVDFPAVYQAYCRNPGGGREAVDADDVLPLARGGLAQRRPENGVIVSSVQIPAISGRLRTELVIEARAIPWEQARLYIT